MLKYIQLKNKLKEKVKEEKGSGAIGIILGIAITFILVAFIYIPGLRSWASEFIKTFTDWARGLNLFPTS